MEVRVRAAGARRNMKELMMELKTEGNGTARNRARPRTPKRAATPTRVSPRLAMRAKGLPYHDIAALLRELGLAQGVAERALEFIVLTACRVGEACHAVWSEFDFLERVWTIPVERSKSGRVHRIPLSDEAVAALERVRGCDPIWVFPGVGNERAGYPTLRRALDRLGYPVAAMLAARAAFRDWARDRPHYPESAVALCLGHEVRQTEPLLAAAQRCDDVETSRILMADWARWCATAQPGA